MQVAVSLIFSLAMILFGAELFTNGVEWLGKKLHLGQGAVGSVLAAIGTAMPETAVPVTAILFGGGAKDAVEIGIGGILGAPFLLATLGSLIVALAVLTSRRPHSPGHLQVEERGFSRDMTYFLLAYAMTMLAGCLPTEAVHTLTPLVLIGLYGAFLVQTLRDRQVLSGSEDELHPLYFQWKTDHPSMTVVVLQLLIALGCIMGGAQLLTKGVEQLAAAFAIPAFVLSALLIPLATELPETFNSVVWIRQGKDGLAFGNITGAMVFQSTLVPALGIWLTPWQLTTQAVITGALTLCAAGMIFALYKLSGRLSVRVFLAASLLYWVLPLQLLASRYQWTSMYWVSAAVVCLAAFLCFRAASATMS
ncbi:sodium:calcium antiporter [Alicyclobacillus cycloheptanicus]|jgi:cation:H+ antiporter|uniref:Cation:H+ antiporter n=1 Tax=Alicyclobacillus cycloheptanicus TaxID=1457 RepID=A0ABT9XE78_9BACL|nr:sodium:calcium antiporter [Alicyclobacillus cycloheptanicus]MDQ0188606.1 cation:H+ antiporter [Alicyclobacillus cycloheptanicus]WDM00711.1 sodium:calcium antiporter [Alicyclobacillus cycloheptanicus]